MRNWILYIVALVLVAIVGVRLYLQYSGSSLPAITTSSGSTSTSSNSGFMDDGVEEIADSDEVVELSETVACQNRPIADTFDLLPAQFVNLARGQTSTLIFPFSPSCFVPGRTYNLRVDRVDPDSGLVYFQEPKGRIEIVKIERTPLKRLPPGLANRLNERRERAQARSNRMDNRRRGTHALVFTVKWEQKDNHRESFGAPQTHPLATVVTRAEVERMLQEGVPVFDARRPTNVQRTTLPGSKPLLMKNSRVIGAEITSPTAMKRRSVKLDNTVLPLDKSAPLIIYSNGPGDFASYNAISLLATEGYQNIKWFRGGIDEWRNLPSETPLTVESVRTVELEEASQLILKGAQPIDVRGDMNYRVRHITGALSRPFFQNVDGDGLPTLRKLNLTHAEIIAANEAFVKDNLEIDKNRPVVVYGRDEYDWRAPKAALALVAMGFKNVYWMRDGMRGWVFASVSEPNKYTHAQGDERGNLSPRQEQRLKRREQRRQLREKQRAELLGS